MNTNTLRDMIRWEAPTRWDVATVIATDPRGTRQLSVRLSGGRISARVLTCLENVEVGDEVLVAHLEAKDRVVVVARILSPYESSYSKLPTLAPPANLAVLGIPGAIQVTWDAYPGEVLCYQVQYNDTADDDSTQTAAIVTRGSVYIHQLIDDDADTGDAETWYYRVRAIRWIGDNNIMYSAWSPWTADTSVTWDGRYRTETELASTAILEGASMIGIEDTGGYFPGCTDVECVLQQMGLSPVGTGTAKQFLKTNAAGNDIEWQSFDWDDVGAGADMQHDHGSDSEGGNTLDQTRLNDVEAFGAHRGGDLSISCGQGLITVTNFMHTVNATNCGAWTEDTVYTIQADGPIGTDHMVILRAGTAFTIEHDNAVGNILLAGGANVSLAIGEVIVLFYDGADWRNFVDGDSGSYYTKSELSSASCDGLHGASLIWICDADDNFPSTVSDVELALDYIWDNSGGTHDMFSATHTDTVAGAAVRGYVMRGNATPAWERHDAKTNHFILVGDGSDITSKAFDWDDLAAGAAADMAHDHSSAAEGDEIPLASLGSHVQGRLVKGGAGDWDTLAIGAANDVLRTNAGGTDPEWGECPLVTLASYTRGYLIRGGAGDWEAYDVSTDHFILVGDGTDIVSKAFDWDDVAAGAAADMVHGHSAAIEGGQALGSTAGPLTLTIANAGCHILDTGGDHDLIITPGTDLSADRILTLTTGDAARTITLSGNPTLSDWFDQAVKVASGPTFANVFVPDGGAFGIAGNELLTVDTVGSFSFGGVTSIVVPNGCWIGADAACAWVFDSASGDVTVLDKVGIGTTSPDFDLDVSGDIRIEGANWLYWGGTGAAPVLGIATKSAEHMHFQSTPANTRTILSVLPHGTVAHTPTALEFYGTDYLADWTNWERLNIQSYGSTAPSVYQIFTSKGGTGTVRNFVLYTGANTSQLYLKSDGNVGVNDSTPGTILEAVGTITATKFTDTGGGYDFFMPNPAKPNEEMLRHWAIETDGMRTIYGDIDKIGTSGEVVVTLPSWFTALNDRNTCVYSLTPFSPSSLYVKRRIDEKGCFVVAGERGVEFSWIVMVARDDTIARGVMAEHPITEPRTISPKHVKKIWNDISAKHLRRKEDKPEGGYDD